MADGTPIGRVRGLGSAHQGPHHWLLQRVTAVGNLLLVLWLVASILMLPNLEYSTASSWLAQPIPAVAMILLVVSTIWHARLGLQVLVEDYVHEAGTKFGLIVLLNLLAVGGAAFAVFSVARLALVGGAV